VTPIFGKTPVAAPPKVPLTTRRIFWVWAPMAATWIMMSVEGLLVAAVVARLPDATVNLAAYGVAFAFALILEAPIIMILSASTALCKDREAFRSLRRFAATLNLGLTALMLAWALSPLYPYVAEQVMSLDPEVAELSRWALLAFLPWPAAIGYRRFYQGLLIRHGHTRRVAYGTTIRVTGMGVTAWLLFDAPISGALIGAASLSVAVVVEAIATRFMVVDCVKEVLATPRDGERLTFPKILHFYIPLLVSSVIALAIHPLVNLFLGHSRLALASLATYPVVAALSFVFRSMGLSFQEVAIAFMDGTRQRFRALARFAVGLGVGACLLQGLMAFTPLSALWFEGVAALTPSLVELSVPALQILVAMPICSVLLAFFRAFFVWSTKTRVITWAGLFETVAVLGVLWILIQPVNMIGVYAASWATLIARAVDLLALLFWGLPMMRRLK
jgi:O-antigen/teichoic acid export membrane protein